ncbi:sensor histidine kinase [Methanothermobacter sp.]|uniref:ATP-binding protein n=1 Tax=Methanothermobacter sp. TaxID=1884223 RepID=UPI00262E76D4|nr:sensor histidine kinase [Methanothermobacter sp.]MDI9618160.1 sensor histidine kinase [Methanothermobacter sp.]
MNLSDYIDELIGELKGMCRGRDVVFRLNLAEIETGINTVVSIGLIVNELLTNAIKHGTGDSGEIKVELDSFKDSGVLIVADDGSGLPEDLDLSDPPIFGLRLVNFMLSRIRGSISA